MKFIRLDPPGTWCQNQAFLELLPSDKGKSFLEIGCGRGDLSRLLCEKGFEGAGVDFSQSALQEAHSTLAPFIAAKRYRLFKGDFLELPLGKEKPDLVFSMMVMEHVPDDSGFLRKMAEAVKPGGSIVVGVPGRKDKWSLEDDLVGHLRRYEREELRDLLTQAGFKDVEVRSVSVPVANLLFQIGNFFVGLSDEKAQKSSQSARQQSQTSGTREIPFKTVFPAAFRLVLNRFVLFPLFVIQRLFYRTNLGLTLIASGRAPA